MLVGRILMARLGIIRNIPTQGLIIHTQRGQYAWVKQFRQMEKGKDVIKKQVQRSQLEGKESDIARKITSAKSLRQLQQFETTIFHEDRNYLFIYLKKVTSLMNKQSYLSNRIFFQQIFENLNRSSSELLLKPNQLLEILFFYYGFKQIDLRNLPKITSGFQYKATILASNYMNNQELTITEAVALMDIITKMGTSSLILYKNLIKFMKTQYQKPDSLKKFDILHLVTLLNINFIKDNHTVLENILFDTTLNYLLNNYEHLLKNCRLEMKFEVLRILLCVDLRLYYLSSAEVRSNLIRILLRKVENAVGEQWLRNLDNLKTQVSQQELNLYQIVTLVQCADYAVANGLINIQIKNQINSLFTRISSQLLKFISKGIHQKLSFKADVVFRILFNPQIFSNWKDQFKENGSLQQIITQYGSQRTELLLPLIDLTLESNFDGQERLNFFNLFSKIHENLMKKGQMMWEIVTSLIETSDTEQFITLLQAIEKKMKASPENRFCFIIILSYVRHHALCLQRKEYLTNILNSYTSQLHQSKNDRYMMIGQINNAFKQLRNPKMIEFSMTIWSELNLFGSSIIYPNKIIRDEAELSLLKLLFSGIGSSDQKISSYYLKLYQNHSFNDNVVYKYLMLMFPSHYPEPTHYNKETKSIISFQFKRTMESILKLFKYEQYYYLIWELFMKNYQLQTREVKLECFEMLRQIFMQVYNRETQRRIVLLSNLTSYISEGTIAATQKQLSDLFAAALRDILSIDDGQFHYYAFMSIIFNTFSCGILSFKQFQSIIKLNSKCSEELKKTSNILMLFVALDQMNSERSPLLTKTAIEEQNLYISGLLKNRSILIMNGENSVKKQGFMGKKKVLEANAKFIAILIMFKEPSLRNYEDQIVGYIDNCSEFVDFMILTEAVASLNSEKPHNFHNHQTKQLFLKKLTIFKNQQLLSEQRYTLLQQKLRFPA